MFLFTTPSLPRLNMPSRERLARLGGDTITALTWAIAITFTAGRLARIGWERTRPGLARLLHALALLVDPQLPVYPDQPEPDPTPEPSPEPAIDSVSALRVLRPDLVPPADGPSVSAAKPRPARQRATRTSAKGAA